MSEVNYGLEKGNTPLTVGLVHWPVLDRAGNTVATNVTNFDVHDIARAGRTYGVERYIIVHRLREQLMFVSRLLDHWRVGRGAKFNPKRRTALTMVDLAENMVEAINSFEKKPIVVATAARPLEHAPGISFKELRGKLENSPDEKVFLIFGTGCGLGDEVLSLCDYILEPISGSSADNYRHLSVRSAVSICLDRLLGKW